MSVPGANPYWRGDQTMVAFDGSGPVGCVTLLQVYWDNGSRSPPEMG